MELDVYFGGNKKKFIISKYIKKFIIPLDEVKRVLGADNNHEVLNLNRRGKLFNSVVMTSEKTYSAVLDRKQIQSGIHFMGQRRDATGFSPMVINGDYSASPIGVLTLILKECDKEGIDGYFLNAFWGYPVKAEPFGKFENLGSYHESEVFWKQHSFRADDLRLVTDAVLFETKPTEEELTLFKKIKGVELNYIGRANLIRNYKSISIDSNGRFYVYRGI